MHDLQTRLESIIRTCPRLMQVLETARRIDLPDWMIFSGAIYQPVWNHLTGRPLDHGVKDYDLGYFDTDTSYEAEDFIIRRVAASFGEPLSSMVEVRNQARVHLWFESRFGEPYSPLRCTAEALTRFTSPAFAVGVRLEQDGSMTIAAPFGLEDMFAMHIRPNPRRGSSSFARIAASATRRWPEVRVQQDA